MLLHLASRRIAFRLPPGAEDVNAAVLAARSAFTAWAGEHRK